MPKDIIWHSGPPPSQGWWPASYSKDNNVYRWWNGITWSIACTRDYTPRAAASVATRAVHIADAGRIYWRARPSNWPARSKT